MNNTFEIDLTTTELFVNIANGERLKYNIDLHNDYICQRLLVEDMLCFSLDFEAKCNRSFKQVKVLFSDILITKIEFRPVHLDSLVVDTIYRGRCEIDGALFESRNERYYYYIDFVEGISFEFWAKNLKFYIVGN